MKGEHPVGMFGEHVTEAFLSCSNPECWQYIEDRITSVKNRYKVEEHILYHLQASAHPDAFKKISRAMLKCGYLRFKKVSEWVDLWITDANSNQNLKNTPEYLETALNFIDNDELRKSSVKKDAGIDLYLALWASAFKDTAKTLEDIMTLLKDPSPERRYPAVHLLPRIAGNHSASYMAKMLKDDDLRIIAESVDFLHDLIETGISLNEAKKMMGSEMSVFEGLPDRFPKTKTNLPPIITGWNPLTADPQKANKLFIKTSGRKNPDKLLPYLKNMDKENRKTASLIAGIKLYPRRNPTEIIEIREDMKSKPPLPRRRGIKIHTPAAIEFLKSLDKFVEEHKDMPVTDRLGEISTLGTVKSYLIWVGYEMLTEEDIDRLPHCDLWKKWWNKRSDSTRDEDGFELLRAMAYPYIRVSFQPDSFGESLNFIGKFGAEYGYQPKYKDLIKKLLPFLLFIYYPEKTVDFLLDSLEELLSQISPEQCLSDFNINEESIYKRYSNDFRTLCFTDSGYINLLRTHRMLFPQRWTNEQKGRYWHLLKWLDEPEFEYNGRRCSPLEFVEEKDRKIKAMRRILPEIDCPVDAFVFGHATETDLKDNLIADSNGIFSTRHVSGDNPHFYLGKTDFVDSVRGYHCTSSGLLYSSFNKIWKHHPEVVSVVNKVRDRILDVELERKNRITLATIFASNLPDSGGIDIFVRCLKKLGRNDFRPKYFDKTYNKNEVLSQLILKSFPPEEESFNEFNQKVKEAGFSDDRLVEIALYAPLWAGYIEKFLGWKGLKSAVLCIHYHAETVYRMVFGHIIDKILEEEIEQLSSYEHPLGNEKVDDQWFYKAYGEMGAERWEKLMEFCKKRKKYKKAVNIVNKLLEKKVTHS
jgi:hypothetical protein